MNISVLIFGFSSGESFDSLSLRYGYVYPVFTLISIFFAKSSLLVSAAYYLLTDKNLKNILLHDKRKKSDLDVSPANRQIILIIKNEPWSSKIL